MTSSIPSENLVGITLNDGWKVVEIIHKHPKGTGGNFSTGYKVNKGNQYAYLKALDFSIALTYPGEERLRKLQDLLEEYNFEKDILEKCKKHRLNKIVHPIAEGSIDVPGFAPVIGTVYYIIFELADGDIRKIKDLSKEFDLSFAFRSLHNVAVGLEQLHKAEIAHQDLKPSNVLVFQNKSKISDLGRASDKNQPFKYDKFAMPGDMNYSPFEQSYGFHFTNDFNERYAADMYLLGSLFFFFFTGLTASQAIRTKIKTLNIALTLHFEHDLPQILYAYTMVLKDLKITLLKHLPEKESGIILDLIHKLCHPDPRKRGEGYGQRYSLERTISKLDLLARRVEYDLHE